MLYFLNYLRPTLHGRKASVAEKYIFDLNHLSLTTSVLNSMITNLDYFKQAEKRLKTTHQNAKPGKLSNGNICIRRTED